MTRFEAELRTESLGCGAAGCVISPGGGEPTAAACHCLDGLDAGARGRVTEALTVLRAAAGLPRERTVAELAGERAAAEGYPCML